MGSDFRVVAKLGEGSFAEVFKVKSNQGNQFFAVKRLKKRYRTVVDVSKLPEILSFGRSKGTRTSSLLLT
jgi:renal tumor antigen